MAETALAERGKEKISAAQAIEIVKKFVKDRFKEDKANSDRALAQARDFAGGQIERVDKDVIDQGRAWATRLALISRTTGNGSGGGYYQTSKPNAALVPIVKKLFGVIGELEAIVATDTEISLFAPVKEDDYFARGYGEDDIRKLKVSYITEGWEPGDTVDADQIADAIQCAVGDNITSDVHELLAQYEIEPIVIPEAPENGEPAKGNGRRRKRS